MTEETGSRDASVSLSTLKRIEGVCLRFEAAWKNGDQPRIEDFVHETEAAERSELLRELLLLELDYHVRIGAQPSESEYRSRFPQDGLLVSEVFEAMSTSVAEGDRPAHPSGVSRGQTLPWQFGDYELLEVLGEGGMGTVYRARHLKLGRMVALKVIRPDRLACGSPGRREEMLKRFQSETQAAARLVHKNIVPVYEVGRFEDQPYFSMRYIEGQTLRERLEDGPLKGPEAVSLLFPVAKAVEYAHMHGVLHRDLKPHNVLIDTGGHPFVTDFGLARSLEDDRQLTHTGEILGTPSYMSPEQAYGESDLGPVTDIYSLGATLYESITGRPPFCAAGIAETLRQVIHDEPVAPRRLNREIDRDLETICLKCLDKKPHRRYGKAAWLADDLERYSSGDPILALPPSRAEIFFRWCRREPKVALLTVAVALLLIICTLLSLSVAHLYKARNAEMKAKLRKSEEEVAKAQALADQRKFEAEAALERKSFHEIEKLNRLISINPSDASSRVRRGDMYVALRLWEPAASDYVAARDLKSSSIDVYTSAATLQLQSGDLEGNKQTCRMILERFSDTDQGAVAYKAAMACLRSPAAEEMLDEIADMAGKAATLSHGEQAESQWAQIVRGLVALRQGNPDRAIAWARQCLNDPVLGRHWDRLAESHLVLAMAHWHLEQPERAFEEFAAAKSLVDEHEPGFGRSSGDIWPWLSIQPILREAERLIMGNKDGKEDAGEL